jgi:signal transduction histidine kinase
VEAKFDNLRHIFLWSLSILAGMIISLLYLYFVKTVIFNNLKNVKLKISQIVIFSVSLALVKIFITYYISVLLSLHDHRIFSLHFFYGIIPAIVTCIIIVPLFANIDYSLKLFNESQKNYINQKIKLQMENITYQQLIESQIESIRGDLSKIFKNIKSDLFKIKDIKSFDKEWMKISKTLRYDASDKIRTRSHELWDEKVIDRHQVKILDFVNFAIKTNSYPSVFVTLLFGISSFPVIFLHFKNHSFIILTGITIIIFILNKLGMALKDFFGIKPLLNYIIIDLLVILTMFIYYTATASIFKIDQNFINYIVGIVWYLFLHLIIVMVTSLDGAKEEIIEKIQSQINSEKLYLSSLIQIEKRINMKLSKFLHGHVQGRVMSQALHLELASKLHDSDLALKSLNEITNELINDYGLKDLAIINRDMETQLNSLVESWKGICEIEILGIENVLDCDDITSDFFIEFVNEASTNSVRHGKSTKIHITFYKELENNIKCEVIDNGIGFEKLSSYGLGFEIFQLLSQSNWTIENLTGKSGCRLTINFAKQSAPVTKLETQKR